MAGTVNGGKAAAKTNLKSDPDFYRKIGAKGGKNGRTGGFASKSKDIRGLIGKERASYFGAIGGRISRRGKAS